MELNNNQVEYLRRQAALIVEDPTNEMTEMWLYWANANVEDIYTNNYRYVCSEELLPIIWVFSKLYDCEPMVIFNLMKRALKRRASVLGFEGADWLDFQDANLALGDVINELVPVRQPLPQQQLTAVK